MWATGNHVVLGQKKVDDKSNEIKAVPELLKLLVIKGCIVTADAMSCQKVIAKDIIGREADYVLALKENQEKLYEDVKLYFDDKLQEKEIDSKIHFFETHEKKHGREDIRRYFITSYKNKETWPFLKE